MALVSPIKNNDPVSIRQAISKLSTKLGPTGNLVCAGLTLTGLDASEFVFTDVNKKLASINVPLTVNYGGSGAATFTDHSILLGSGTGAFTALGAATNGQLPIGSTGNDPTLAVLTQGTGITVTNAAGSITIATTISQYTNEQAQDAVGGILDNGAVGNIVFTYNDGDGIISAATQDGEINHDSLLNVHQDVNTDVSPAFTGFSLSGTGEIDITNTAAAGDIGLDVSLLQGTNALTGTLRGIYSTVTNGEFASSGTIRALEGKARAATSGLVGGNVGTLEGMSLTADAKNKTVTTLRGAEIIMDAQTGAAITTATGIRISNNFQSNAATTSYGLHIYRDSFDYTKDILLSKGGTITGDSYLNQDVRTTGSPTFAEVKIADAGYIGSVSDTDAIQIEADGDVVFSQKVGVGGTSVRGLWITGSGANAEFTLENTVCPVDQKRFNMYIHWDGGSNPSYTVFRTVNDAFTVGPAWMRANNSNQNVSLGGTVWPTAHLHLSAGAAAAELAPLKFSTGTNLTTPEAGAMEFDGTNLYFTPTDTRKTIGLLTTTISDGDLTHSPDGNSVFDALALKAPIASPTFTGAVTMPSSVIIPDGGTIGQAAGPLLTFDDANNYLEITGCNVGIGITNPFSLLSLKGLNPILTIDSSVADTETVAIKFLHVGGTQAASFHKAAILSDAVGDNGRANLRLAVNIVAGPDSVSVSDARLSISGTTGYVGIGTSAPAKSLEINSVTGQCLRLTYNDSDGSASNYMDFSIGSTGTGTIESSNGTIYIDKGMYWTRGSNVLTGGTASASTDRGGTTYAAAKAVDGNEATRWTTDDSAVPGWWKYDLGAGVTKIGSAVRFVLKSTEITNAFTIDGSNDDSSWDTLYTGNGENNQNWQYFTLNNPTAYRYYRISISSVYSGVVCSISEIHLYESFLDIDGNIRTTGKLGVGISTPKTRLTVEGAITLKEQASADADTAAYGQIWVKNATPNELWFTDDTGTDHNIFYVGSIELSTVTGTKIGTATNQLLGFYNATPVDQPATVADATGGLVVDTEARTAINTVIDRLQELGLVA